MKLKALKEASPSGALKFIGWVLLVALGFFASPSQAIEFVGSTSERNNGDTITVGVPTDTVADDVMVVQLGFRGDSEVSVVRPSGWKKVVRTNHESDMVQVTYYRVAEAGEPADYTWSTSGGNRRLTAVNASYRNVDNTDPVDAFSESDGTGSGTSITAPGLTVEDPRSWLLGLFASEHGNQVITSPSSMTGRENPASQAGQNGLSSLLADESVADSGDTGSRTATAEEDVPHIGQMVALRPAPAGAPQQLSFGVQPSDTPVGQVISPAVEVRIEDADGQLVTDSDATVQIAIGNNPVNGTLGGTTTVDAVNGVATFDDLTIDEIGDGYTLLASSSGLDSATSDPFNITELDQEANAFDTDTPSEEIVGDITTKVAGEAFSLDVVGINNGEVDSSFNEDARVELWDASDNSGTLSDVNCRDSWEHIADVGTLHFDPQDNGRKTLSDIVEGEAWREVRVRLVEDANNPDVLGCSNDAFAIRPDRFEFIEVTNDDGGELAYTAPDSGPVEIAGGEFAIRVEAVNDNGTRTTNYAATSDIAVQHACIGETTPCVDGKLDPGSWSATDGVLATTNATYSEVGAFELDIEDRGFASVDGNDTTKSQRFFSTATTWKAGRFIPDRFILEVGSESLADRAALTCPSTPDFTYIGERFDNSYTLKARAAASVGGNVTENYEGAFGHLVSVADLGIGATDGSTNLTGSLKVGAPELAWSLGSATIRTELELKRTSPEEPYDPIHIGIFPRDEDGVELAPGVLDLDVDGDGSADHLATGSTELRFGRLNLGNVHGSELEALEVPVRAEYYDDGAFGLNPDDGCTPLSRTGEADHVRMQLNDNGAWKAAENPVDLAGGTGGTTEGTGVTGVANGVGALTLTAPGAGNTGYVPVRADLADFPWLRGDWNNDGSYTENPTARATFGRYQGNDRILFWREVYH